MDTLLLDMVIFEEKRGIAKWGEVDRTPQDLLCAAAEELGEVAHAVNHNEGKEKVRQEIAEVIGVLSRLDKMVMTSPEDPGTSARTEEELMIVTHRDLVARIVPSDNIAYIYFRGDYERGRQSLVRVCFRHATTPALTRYMADFRKGRLYMQALQNWCPTPEGK